MLRIAKSEFFTLLTSVVINMKFVSQNLAATPPLARNPQDSVPVPVQCGRTASAHCVLILYNLIKNLTYFILNPFCCSPCIRNDEQVSPSSLGAQQRFDQTLARLNRWTGIRAQPKASGGHVAGALTPRRRASSP
jgi:hypothetical protein